MAPTLADCLDRRTNDLAAVRILAATAVLHAHAWLTTTSGLQTENFFHIFAFTLDFHAVHAFFILSGMLLTRSLMEKRDLVRFVTARLTRYIPGIFVAAVFAALVVGPAVTRLPLNEYVTGGLAGFVALVTTLKDVDATLPGVFEGHPQPGLMFIPLWTIHYELVFSIALGVLGVLGLLRIRTLVALGLIATIAVNVVWFWNGEEHLRLGTPHHLVRFASAFGIGIAMAVFADKIPVSRNIMIALVLFSLPLAYGHVAALAGMVLIAYAILCIGFAGGPLASALARLGTWSYGFYVWGYLIEQTIVHVNPQLSAWVVFVLAFPLALAAGWLSWVYVEKPSIERTGVIAAWLNAQGRRLRDAAGRLRGGHARPASVQRD